MNEFVAPNKQSESNNGNSWLHALFGFFSIFTFIPNPLFPNNEIIPYYGLLAFVIVIRTFIGGRYIDYLVLRFLAASFFLILLSTLIDNGGAALDVVAIAVVLISLSAYRVMSISQVQSFDLGIWSACILAFILLVLQIIYPPLIDIVYQTLTIRQGNSDHIVSYSGGAIGFAPEPAYMASFLLGPFSYFLYLGKLHIKKTIVIAISILMTGSLSGVMLMFAVVIILEFKYIFRTIRGNILLVLGIVMLGVVYIINERLFSRVDNVIQLILENGVSLNTLQIIDTSFGSNRLRTLIEPLSSVCCGALFTSNYTSPYSLFATLFYLIAPLHFVIIFLVCPLRIINRFQLVSLFLFVFSGPILNWIAYLGFAYGRTKNKNGYL